MKKREWEMFYDRAYFDMWAVRPAGDTDFNSPQLFHFADKSAAEEFKVLVERAISALPIP